MAPPEMAALVAGIGVLMMTFAMFQIASHALLDNRLRVFVRRRGVAMQPTSVRRPSKESKVAFVEQLNRKLRQANYGKRLQAAIARQFSQGFWNRKRDAPDDAARSIALEAGLFASLVAHERPFGDPTRFLHSLPT